MRFSAWIKEIYEKPGLRSPNWSFHSKQHGFRPAITSGEAGGWADIGFNRMKEKSVRPFVQTMLNKAEWDDKWDTGTIEASKMIESLRYAPKQQLMLVTFKEARTGGNGGVPPGTQTIYDHVTQHTYEMLFYQAKTGHIGKMFWDMVRVRGFQQESQYPYSDMP